MSAGSQYSTAIDLETRLIMTEEYEEISFTGILVSEDEIIESDILALKTPSQSTRRSVKSHRCITKKSHPSYFYTGSTYHRRMTSEEDRREYMN